MNPTEFKKLWMTNDSERWVKFPIDQVEKSNLNEKTKEFLKIGFPEDAAPFLGFGLRSYDWEFNTIQSKAIMNMTIWMKKPKIIGFSALTIVETQFALIHLIMTN